MFPRKDSWTGNSFGQLSLKEEAAGKLRVFAMVDNLTQSVLRPLHLALQDLLRLIPNDGTFDQDESVQRSAKKASSSGCAFSFDLSAATDRLPVALSSTILSSILSLPIGDPWMRLLIDREYSFNEKTQAKYGCPDSVRYSVGQPMGALSS
jgi:hypothetical protein